MPTPADQLRNSGAKVAVDSAAVAEADVDELRAVGLSDNDIVDIVFAVAARCFFATVLDGVGVNADHQLAAAFDPSVTEQLTVGRPIAVQPGRPEDRTSPSDST